MSVPKSRRGVSPVEYIKVVTLLSEVTTCYLRRFPTKGAKYLYIKDIVNNIEVNCQYANTLYINKNSNKELLKKKLSYIKEAIEGCDVLSSQISKLYEFIKYKGVIENPFKTINDLNRKFIRWQTICDNLQNLLNDLFRITYEKYKKGEK